MKYILEQNNLFYITDGKMTRVIHLKSWDAKDTTNETTASKVVEQGEEVASPHWPTT